MTTNTPKAAEAATLPARRAVASKHWRWMPGIRTMGGFRCVELRNIDEPELLRFYDGGDVEALVGDDLPDIDDPATLGCLLALVREAWGSAHEDAHARRGTCFDGKQRWAVVSELSEWSDMSGGHGYDSEAEALVAALEAAP